MYTDLFLALLNRKNARGHPILSAMLYAFCPTAARWWLVGADPTPPFDPVWKSLEDLSSGGTLLEFLIKHDFDSLIEETRAYIREVEDYRRQHNNLRAPELMPLFRSGKISMSRRFGSQNAINNLGGDWRNLFIYVPTWDARRLYDHMQLQDPAISTLPKEFPSDLHHELQAARAQDDFYYVVGGNRNEGAVVVSLSGDLPDFFPMHKVVVIPFEDPLQLVDRIHPSTQAVGIYPESLKKPLRDLLVARVCLAWQIVPGRVFLQIFFIPTCR